MTFAAFSLAADQAAIEKSIRIDWDCDGDSYAVYNNSIRYYTECWRESNGEPNITVTITFIDNVAKVEADDDSNCASITIIPKDLIKDRATTKISNRSLQNALPM